MRLVHGDGTEVGLVKGFSISTVGGAPEDFEFLSGYTVREVNAPVKPHEDIPIVTRVVPRKTVPVQRRIGPAPAGMALPMADRRDVETVKHAVENRLFRKHPKPSKPLLRKLRSFVRLFCKRHFDPIEPTQLLTFDEWLASTSYNEARKDELRKVKSQHVGEIPCGKDLYVKSHIKDENYEEYKVPRGIYSRTDYFKAYYGPYMKSIEKIVFEKECFIKKIPVTLRPKYLKDRLGICGPYYVTDYSAYESSFSPEFMWNVECQLYKHMLKNFEGVSDSYNAAITGENVIKFRDVATKVRGKRMSGEITTSLGNSFSNLMIMLFVCSQAGMCEEDVVGVVEGDDGLFWLNGKVPEMERFSELGFDLKLEKVDNFCLASFCGIVADEIDLDTVRDPRTKLISLGWSHSQQISGKKNKLRGLLLAKALSLVAELPHCPILTHFGLKMIELTKHHKPIFKQDWWNTQLKELVEKQIGGELTPSSVCRLSDGKIGLRTRALVDHLYGISYDMQIKCEDAIAKIKHLDDPLPTILCDLVKMHPNSMVWMEYYNKFRS